jgi:hypothetical protein
LLALLSGAVLPGSGNSTRVFQSKLRPLPNRSVYDPAYS